MFPFTCCPTSAPLQIQLSQKKKKSFTQSDSTSLPLIFLSLTISWKRFLLRWSLSPYSKANKYVSHSQLTQPLSSFQLKDHPSFLKNSHLAPQKHTHKDFLLPPWPSVLARSLEFASTHMFSFSHGFKKVFCTYSFHLYIAIRALSSRLQADTDTAYVTLLLNWLRDISNSTLRLIPCGIPSACSCSQLCSVVNDTSIYFRMLRVFLYILFSLIFPHSMCDWVRSIPSPKYISNVCPSHCLHCQHFSSESTVGPQTGGTLNTVAPLLSILHTVARTLF